MTAQMSSALSRGDILLESLRVLRLVSTALIEDLTQTHKAFHGLSY